MTRMKLCAVVCLLALVSVAMPARAATPKPAATPTEVVKNFCAVLLDTMKQGEQLGFAGRAKKLQPEIAAAYNLPLMTRMAVGPGWAKASPEEQQALIAAFSSFSTATYASRFTAYNGEKFDVRGEKPAANGAVLVETTLTPKDSDAIVLNYLTRADETGNWRIVDVFMNGSISELATRRAEFSSIVKRDGIPALVNTLGDKARQMGPT